MVNLQVGDFPVHMGHAEGIKRNPQLNANNHVFFSFLTIAASRSRVMLNVLNYILSLNELSRTTIHKRRD